MNITITSKEVENQKITAALIVPAADVNAALAKTYMDLSQKYNFQGFRKGHVPRQIINNVVGKAAVAAQTTEDVLRAAEPLLLEELDVTPIGRVSYEDTTKLIEENADFSLTATIKMRPTCELSSYDAPTIDMPSDEVTQSELDEEISTLLSYQAVPVDVEEDRPAQAGDLVSLNIENIQGASYLAGENRLANLDSKQLPPDLEAAVIGMNKGETKEVEWDRSHEHEGEVHSVHFAVKVTLNTIKIVQSPELNEDSAKKFGYDSVDAFKEAVKEEMQAEKARRMPNLKEDRAIEALGNLLVLDEVPADYQGEIFNELATDFLGRLQQQNMTLDSYLSARGSNSEDFIADLQAQATERARQSLALDSLAAHLGLEATPEDVMGEFINAAPDNAEELLEQWRENGRLPAIRDSIKRSKALDWLLENVVVHVVDEDTSTEQSKEELEPASEAELEGAPEAESAPEAEAEAVTESELAADPEVSE